MAFPVGHALMAVVAQVVSRLSMPVDKALHVFRQMAHHARSHSFTPVLSPSRSTASAVMITIFPALCATCSSRSSRALQDPHGMRKAMIGPASYVVGAATTWFSIPAAFVIYALTPLFYITPPKWHGPAAAEPRHGDAR
jgi:hypothetical protein